MTYSIRSLLQSVASCRTVRSRRALIRGTVIGVAALLTGTSLSQATELSVPLVYIGDTGTSAYQGARQGLAEAQSQGDFLGQKYTLEAFSSRAAAAGQRPTAVIAALPATRLLNLAEHYPDTAIFNLTAGEDELRELCAGNLLHVVPSRAMLADAKRQWQRKEPGSQAVAQAWHRDFRKYAAAQLNMRYRERFGQAMDDKAWAGWAAVKLLSDMVAREQTADAGQLLEAVKTKLAFDGQKGIDMSFRETGQLRQPLLLVENDKLVGEAPVRGVVATTNLDSLGLSHCPK